MTVVFVNWDKHSAGFADVVVFGRGERVIVDAMSAAIYDVEAVEKTSPYITAEVS
jgi:hypothetical protein